jgi:short chain dehydrogenase
MSRITSMTDGLTKEGSATKVWIVTGSASGLGRNIALAVLASGDRLVATARDPRRLEDLVQKYGDQIRTAPLDVADEDAACRAVQAAVDAFGRLDVVVNNAGYGDIAPFEQTNWGARASKDTPDLIPDYEASVGAVAGMLKSYWGHETGDPGKVAQVVLRLAASDRLPAHLLLGSDAVQYAGQAEAARAADAERWREVSVSTDVDGPGSLPALRF